VQRIVVGQLISVIRNEEKLRVDRLADADPDAAYDQWMFYDRPLINEMYLMLLLSIRHQVERQLLFVAARANHIGTITRKEYRQNVMEQRKLLRRKEGFQKLTAKLKLRSFPEWGQSMKTLELLANSLKHNPWQEPDEHLLGHLKLPTGTQLTPIVSYMPLPESTCFQEGLANSLNLPKHSDYGVIVETFAGLANQFLEAVQEKTPMGRVSGRISTADFGC
jgi:hypothetical protein